MKCKISEILLLNSFIIDYVTKLSCVYSSQPTTSTETTTDSGSSAPVAGGNASGTSSIAADGSTIETAASTLGMVAVCLCVCVCIRAGGRYLGLVRQNIMEQTCSQKFAGGSLKKMWTSY